MSTNDEKQLITDEIKESVMNSGALSNLKNVAYDSVPASRDNEPDDLKDQANTAVENIQQLLDSGRLDDGTSLKLAAVLSKLKTAMGKGAVSRDALALAISEATAAIGSVDGAGKNTAMHQTAEQTWQKIEAYNKEINDDFEKMQKAGIVFNQSLWNRHKELTEYLETHPRDIKTQKELDAVDDALLLQAEPQLKQHPDAKKPFGDAKKTSEERHEAVDRDLVAVDKKKSARESAFDDESYSSAKEPNANLNMNDVVSQTVGQKPKPIGKQHG